ncbi:MAG: excinuclease ABC subunit UvrC [Methanoregula sp.]|uniref:excinuclease ABC subunit UvrC n=1 Tax=Methanoregula sp. TaxID=2052170 RepID=UPI0025E00E7B|nr:excinuclease ABC subunit UvrC [Methanoregula sp.]MCK9632124.1 excinuclease ABC subunit UvrC [Methanoregula sp.]
MFDTATLPGTPGCYLFYDNGGTIIYVGKAKNLKKRVSSYFQKKDHDKKTLNLVAAIARVSVMVTNTETEAFLLENNLIKKHQPKYNIDLKDAKRYAYIELTREQFPRIGIARRTGKGESTFFGPFVSAAERDALIRIIRKVFLLRSCRRLPKRACLRHHMHTCSAPCVGAISEEEYHLQVERAASLLKGRSSELLLSLREEMAGYSAREEYEKALSLRNQIAAVTHLAERQHVERPKETDQDVIGYAVSDDTVYLMVFSVEKGLLTGKQEYSFENREDFFEEFLVQYYADRIPPSELILPHDVDEAMAGYLSERKGKSVQVTIPKIGEKKKLLDLVEKNLEHAFLKNELKVKDLQSSLGLADAPDVIECFDISHLSGTAMVGSMVRFRNGVPDKKNYRRFKIKTVEGIDDFASIAEVVKRRYDRLIREDAEMPDLIIIDGGKGQLSAAGDSLRDLDLTIPVIALAKREEEVYLPGETLPRQLDKKAMALHYLQEIRDEAHRFAIAYNRLLRNKSAVAGSPKPGKSRKKKNS